VSHAERIVSLLRTHANRAVGSRCRNQNILRRARSEEPRPSDREYDGDRTSVEFDVKDNGRGPTIAEVIRTGAHGLPVEWSIQGTTTFGSKVDERFRQSGARAEWTDASGPASAPIDTPALYVPQAGSPWQNQILVRALLRAPGMTLPGVALPANCALKKARRSRCPAGADP
jgi:hypothetical protein